VPAARAAGTYFVPAITIDLASIIAYTMARVNESSGTEQGHFILAFRRFETAATSAKSAFVD
jgi:hypothetical protein